MLQLDISDSGSHPSENDRLIADFLGTSEDLIEPEDYTQTDLISGFMIPHSENNNGQPTDNLKDLMDIFQEHDDALTEGQRGQSC